MPIYEYACSECRTVFQFWSQQIATTKVPACPKCGNEDMQKMLSSFAIGKAQSQAKANADSDAGADAGAEPDPFANMTPDQQAKVEKEMMKLMSQADSLDENDPRQMGSFMRKLTESTGVDMGPEVNEAIRRLEKGEDLEKIEEEMGDIFSEMGENLPGGGAPDSWSYDDSLYDL